jgi:uncharacterized membrane protein YphA (DoxX/SURF4 family)
MDIVLWIVQGLLAFAFLMAGVMKWMQTREKLMENPAMAWTEDFSQNQLRGIGALEIAAAIGLILPMALDILPFFTPLAALGLVLLMIGAALTHYRRNETQPIMINTVLGLLALFVLIGRLFIESVI